MDTTTVTRKAAFRFTKHSIVRLGQRTHISREDILELLKRGQDLRPKTVSIDRGRLFWSPTDDCAYLAIYNYRSSKVITVMPSYEFNEDGHFEGTWFTEHGIAGSPNARRPVKAHHVRRLLKFLGIAPRPEFSNPDAETGPQEITYEATLRLAVINGTSRKPTLRIGAFRVMHGAEEVPVASLIYALRKKLLRKYGRGQERLSPIVHATISMSRRGALSPEREIELPPRWFARMEQAGWYPELADEKVEQTLVDPLMELIDAE